MRTERRDEAGSLFFFRSLRTSLKISQLIVYREVITLRSKIHTKHANEFCEQNVEFFNVNPYPTAFPYGNGMVLHFYQQQESSTTKTVHKVINKGLKTYV